MVQELISFTQKSSANMNLALTISTVRVGNLSGREILRSQESKFYILWCDKDVKYGSGYIGL